MSAENIEKELPDEERKWMEYEHSMDELAINSDFNQLEDLLREDHPLLPGEKEAFEELKNGLGRELRVKLDKSGFHVIRAEEEEKDNSD